MHTETRDGNVIPVWEEADLENISVLKDIMASRKNVGDVELKYARVPVTAARPPDFSDLTDLIDVAVRHPNAPIVVHKSEEEKDRDRRLRMREEVRTYFLTCLQVYETNLQAIL